MTSGCAAGNERMNVSTVAEYIAARPPAVRKKLKQLRAIVKHEAPDALEKLSYGMPYYALNGRLVYFASFMNHVSLFPMTSGVRAFKSRLAKFTHGKGSVQFPHDHPLPVALIRQIVKFRVAENRKREHVMPYDEELVQRVRLLMPPRLKVEEKKMMGALTFMVQGKMCVCVVRDDLMARIDPEEYESALKKKGCREMDYTGRAMKGFVFVGPEGTKTKRDLESWIALALEYNKRAKIAPKKKKRVRTDRN
jgi:uncharacterized protein YdhG (YjbR/CyaY superfamily)/TfoX/Sxy family transcriptional regulator of competence genes